MSWVAQRRTASTTAELGDEGGERAGWRVPSHRLMLSREVPSRPHSPPRPARELAGRATELRLVSEALATTGRLRAVLLEGEAGIGKTALWRAAIAEWEARGARVLSVEPGEAETEANDPRRRRRRGKQASARNWAGLVVVVQGGREIFDERGFRSRGGKRAPRSSLWRFARAAQ